MVNWSNKNVRHSEELSNLPTLLGNFFPQPILKGNSPNYNLVPQFFEITFLAIKICCI